MLKTYAAVFIPAFVLTVTVAVAAFAPQDAVNGPAALSANDADLDAPRSSCCAISANKTKVAAEDCCNPPQECCVAAEACCLTSAAKTEAVAAADCCNPPQECCVAGLPCCSAEKAEAPAVAVNE